MYVRALSVQHSRKNAETRAVKKAQIRNNRVSKITQVLDNSKVPTTPTIITIQNSMTTQEAQNKHNQNRADNRDARTDHPMIECLRSSEELQQLLWITWPADTCIAVTGSRALSQQACSMKTLQQCYLEKFGEDLAPHEWWELRKAEQEIMIFCEQMKRSARMRAEGKLPLDEEMRSTQGMYACLIYEWLCICCCVYVIIRTYKTTAQNNDIKQLYKTLI